MTASREAGPRLALSSGDAAFLDDPVWAALLTVQAKIAIGNALARRYPADVAPFAAMGEASPAAYDALLALVPEADRVALFTADRLSPPASFAVLWATEVLQMVVSAPPAPPNPSMRIVRLGPHDVPAMLRLVEATKPGPFGPRTHTVGDYLGVWDEGELVAMAGERMRMPGFVEISAVCVRPDHRGRGLAHGVVATLVTAALQRGEVPFLHAFADNAGAIGLYERLGFVTRRRLQVTALGRVDPASA